MSSQADDATKNIWEEVKGKVLSDLLYKDGGKIITADEKYFSGHYIVYHVMVGKTLFKCTDELDDHPVDDGRAEKSNCYKLKLNKSE